MDTKNLRNDRVYKGTGSTLQNVQRYRKYLSGMTEIHQEEKG